MKKLSVNLFSFGSVGVRSKIVGLVAGAVHCCLRRDFNLFLENSCFFGSTCVDSKIIGFVSFCKRCSVVAD